jgi:hypothetical protein
VASVEIGPEVHYDKTKYRVISRDQNAGRIHSIKTDNSSFERQESFKYLKTVVIYQNSIQDVIESRLKPGNACYHSVQNILSSSLLSKNLKFTSQIYRTIILSVVLNDCETWSLIWREKVSLSVFENRKLHNEEHNDLHSSSSIVRVTKSRIM